MASRDYGLSEAYGATHNRIISFRQPGMLVPATFPQLGNPDQSLAVLDLPIATARLKSSPPATVLALGYGLVNGLFIAKLTPITVAGVDVFQFAFNFCGGVLRHSPFWISFGPRVERWVISPEMHHLHHSNKAEHFDKNMGGALAVWDRLADTLHIPKGREIEGFAYVRKQKIFDRCA